MVTSDQIFLASPIGKEISEWLRQKGREEGREQGREEGRGVGREEGRGVGREEGRGVGREEGRLVEVRQNVVTLIEARFPGLLDTARIDALSDLNAVQELFRAVAAAPDFSQARAAAERILGSRS